jgi:hypothetical protein
VTTTKVEMGYFSNVLYLRQHLDLVTPYPAIKRIMQSFCESRISFSSNGSHSPSNPSCNRGIVKSWPPCSLFVIAGNSRTQVYGCDHGLNQDQAYDGVLAEYIMVKGDVTMHTPANLEMEDHCT